MRSYPILCHAIGLHLVALTIALLSVSPRSAQGADGLRIVTDNSVGIRIGIPEDFPIEGTRTPWGQTWASADGGIAVNSLAFPRGQQIEAIYARLTSIKRRVISLASGVSGGRFILAGRDIDGNAFYMVARQDGEAVRGFSIIYTESRRAEYADAIARIVRSSEFVSSPERTPMGKKPLDRTSIWGRWYPVKQNGTCDDVSPLIISEKGVQIGEKVDPAFCAGKFQRYPNSAKMTFESACWLEGSLHALHLEFEMLGDILQTSSKKVETATFRTDAMTTTYKKSCEAIQNRAPTVDPSKPDVHESSEHPCQNKSLFYSANGEENAKIEVVFTNAYREGESIGGYEFIIREIKNNKIEWSHKGTHILGADNPGYLEFTLLNGNSAKIEEHSLPIDYISPDRNQTGESILYVKGLRHIFRMQDTSPTFQFDGKRPDVMLPEAFYFDHCN